MWRLFLNFKKNAHACHFWFKRLKEIVRPNLGSFMWRVGGGGGRSFGGGGGGGYFLMSRTFVICKDATSSLPNLPQGVK